MSLLKPDLNILLQKKYLIAIKNVPKEEGNIILYLLWSIFYVIDENLIRGNENPSIVKRRLRWIKSSTMKKEALNVCHYVGSFIGFLTKGYQALHNILSLNPEFSIMNIDLWLPYLGNHLFLSEDDLHKSIVSIMKLTETWKPEATISREFFFSFVNQGIQNMDTFMKMKQEEKVVEYVLFYFIIEFI